MCVLHPAHPRSSRAAKDAVTPNLSHYATASPCVFKIAEVLTACSLLTHVGEKPTGERERVLDSQHLNWVTAKNRKEGGGDMAPLYNLKSGSLKRLQEGSEIAKKTSQTTIILFLGHTNSAGGQPWMDDLQFLKSGAKQS